MLISTQTSSFSYHFGDHNAIKMLADIGYDALDYSMFFSCEDDHPINRDDYRDYAKSLRKTADDKNIIFNQSHAPMPSYYTKEPEKTKYNERIFSMLIRTLEVSSIIGSKIMVVHPIILKGGSYDAQKELNMKFYNNLLPFCKEFNVKIALENIGGWDEEAEHFTPATCSTPSEFIDYLDTLDSDWFTACLDIAHAELKWLCDESASEFIRLLGHKRLKALHIHENDKLADMHTIPFSYNTDWNEIAAALKSIDYDGDLTFEADYFLETFPEELIVSASTFMLDIGKHLVKMITEQTVK